MTRSDWTLLALAAAEGQPLTPVQLQKTLFFLGKDCGDSVGSHFYHFRPYNYGPFDAAVYSDAEALENDGLAIRIRSPGRSWVEYAATPAGIARATKLRPGAPPVAVSHVQALVRWARRLSFEQLVKAVYHAYPETKARSIFHG